MTSFETAMLWNLVWADAGIPGGLLLGMGAVVVVAFLIMVAVIALIARALFRRGRGAK